MHPFRPWLFRASFPWHRFPPTTSAAARPFIPISSPTTYRGWRVLFPSAIRLDVAALQRAGYPITILRAN